MAAMTDKMLTRVVGQFHRPHGLGGQLAGWVMAARSSNRRRNAWAVGLLDVAADDRVLEVGFGPGLAIRESSRLAGAGQVHGVDHSEVMLRQARRRNARAVREGRVVLQVGSIEDLPRFDDPFDKILAVNCLQFSDDPVARLEALRELLADGGLITVASQPRCPGATDETSAAAGRSIAAQLAEAGFTDVRVETLPLRPAVVGVIGRRSAVPIEPQDVSAGQTASS